MNPGFLALLKKNWKVVLFTIIFLLVLNIGFGAIIGSLACSYISGVFGVPQPRGFGNAGGNSTVPSSTSTPNPTSTFEEDCFVELVQQTNSNVSKEKALEYKKYIEEAASSMGVNTAAIAAVAEQESAWVNHNCSGDKLSRGIMQVQTKYQKGCSWGIYEVWKNEAIPLAKKYGGQNISDIMSERDSFIGGTAILRKNLNSFNGEYYKAFAAYNAGVGGASNGRGTDYASEVNVRYNKYKKCIDTPTTPTNIQKGKYIILHWTADNYNTAYPNSYNYTILGNGTVKSGSGGHHAVNRNDAIGISIAAGCDPSNSSVYPSDDVLGTKTFGGCGRPIKQVQYNKMVEPAAQVAKKNNISVDKNHIMSHGEAAAMKDFSKDLVKQVSNPNQAKCTSSTDDKKAINLGLPHCNYGPGSWKDGWPGGCRRATTRWEYWEHEDTIRNDIRSKMGN